MSGVPGIIASQPTGCNCTPAWLTGDRTGSITVSMGGPNISIWSGTASNAVDGSIVYDANGSWAWGLGVPTIGSSDYVRFDFGAPTLVTDARANKLSPPAGQGTWQWQGSDDAVSWTDIGSPFSFSGASNPFTLNGLSGNETGYRYYQMKGVSSTITSAEWLAEVEFKQCTC